MHSFVAQAVLLLAAYAAAADQAACEAGTETPGPSLLQRDNQATTAYATGILHEDGGLSDTAESPGALSEGDDLTQDEETYGQPEITVDDSTDATEISVLDDQGDRLRFYSSDLVSAKDGEQLVKWGAPDSAWAPCYKKSRDGGNAQTFHQKCDDKGPTVTVVRLQNGAVLGGYSDVSWDQSRKYKASRSAFLFSLTNTKKFPIRNGRGDYQIYGNYNYGPTFGGGHDLYIAKKMGKVKCGSYSYSTDAGLMCKGTKGRKVKDLEVFIKVPFSTTTTTTTGVMVRFGRLQRTVRCRLEETLEACQERALEISSAAGKAKLEKAKLEKAK